MNKATILVIAAMAHGMNRAYCEALGDTSQLPWEESPQWQKNSAVMGVELHLGNPDAGPEASHESWMAQKEAEGWVYGEVKDPEKKEHPCMVPFSELPTDQQAKDFIFRECVHQAAKIVAVNDASIKSITEASAIEQPAGAIEAIRKAVGLIDPKGKGHIPSGDSGVYQQVLETLNAVLDAADTPEEAEQAAE